MFSRPLALLLLALGCVTAAAGGAYLATRHNAMESVVATAPATGSAAPTAAPPPSTQAVAETETAVTAEKADKKGSPAAPPRNLQAEAAPAPAARRADPPAQKSAPVAPGPSNTARSDQPAARTVPMTAGSSAQPQAEPQASPTQAPPPPPAPEPSRPVEPQPEPPRVPQFEEVILPASSVIGLQLETSLSSERARLEDRVDARVSRDVMAAGRVAIPAGARVVGSVIEIDKGGKVKTPAHIGIRFHTLVLADGSEVALRTNPIYRDAESPAGNSAKKIGGAAVAGAILGGIMGGGKGAAIGAATGAGGGTAAVMSGDRTVVNIPSGTFVNATLSSPATVTVERRE